MDSKEKSDTSFENEFEDRINSMTLDDLRAEREHLREMGAMSGDEIAEQYAEEWNKKSDADVMDEFLDAFDKKELQQIRDIVTQPQDDTEEWPEGADDTGEKPPQLTLKMRPKTR